MTQQTAPTLIERLKTYEDMKGAIEGLRIASRALAYYADPKNWKDDDWGVRGVIEGNDYGDPGKRARNALKRIEKVLKT